MASATGHLLRLTPNNCVLPFIPRASLLFVMVIGGAGTPTRAGESRAAGLGVDALQVAGLGEVSGAFRAEFQRAADSIPAPIWNGLSQRGWSVRLTRFLEDAAPQLRNERPRGWPNNRTWDSVEAVHLPDTRTLIIAELKRYRDGTSRVNVRVAGVLRHEVGHAFDMLAARNGRFRSASQSFRAAYVDDIAVMDRKTRNELHYFLQRGAAGRQETFAEAFAIELGGGSDEGHRALFEQAFPRVINNVREAIERVEAKE